MRKIRILFGAVGLAAVVMVLSACSTLAVGAASTAARGAPAAARGGVWVQVSPGSVSPGFSVQVRADCLDNSNSAEVTSKAFGMVTVQPWNTLLLADVTIPKTTAPGTFDVTVKCRTGSTATTTLTIVGSTAAPAVTHGPNTGGGFLAKQAGTGSPFTSGPVQWFTIGVVALLAAAFLGVLATRRRRALARPRTQPARVRDRVR